MKKTTTQLPFAVFILITLALLGIIVFQTYWTVNAYRINKEKFDTNVNIAMQRAMDDCKRDYFDSIRRVLVKRLSPPETTIKIDTLHDKDTTNAVLTIHISDKYSSSMSPFTTTASTFNFYKKKLGYNSTIPAILTEMSFYEPALMNSFTVVFGMHDIQQHSAQLMEFVKTHPDASGDAIRKFTHSLPNSIYELPPNFEAAASHKIWWYLKNELNKMHINSPFGVLASKQSIPHFKLNLHYTETVIYPYKYQGFTLFNISGPVIYVRAVFHKPQYAIIKKMLFSLMLSILLILFTIYCFYYIARTIIDQKKLADLKDDFINNMTHELKTPIATMTVAIEGLQRFNVLSDPEKTQRYLQTSRNELARLNDLVTRVLDIAAFENREINLDKENININDLVTDVIQSEKSKTNKTVDITFINKDGIELIYADRLHFRNVLINIVDNAIKYSNEPVDIVINCYKNPSSLVFSVKDNGMGIPEAHIRQIFDKFHRVPTGNIHSVKGTGLGLSYVKYIVEAHGGTITVKSEINKGSEFIVSIPLTDG
jgi:signal transduction histidine kinase